MQQFLIYITFVIVISRLLSTESDDPRVGKNRDFFRKKIEIIDLID